MRLTLLLAVAGSTLAAAPASALTTVRLDGIGPLKLGMSRTAAVGTGWLSDKGKGCELASPRATTYQLDGKKAPAAIKATAEFSGGKLTVLSFTAGVRTSLGVIPGKTTLAGMEKLYDKAGFTATRRFDTTFQATFVNVKKAGDLVLNAIGAQSRVQILGIPSVPLCE